MTKRIEWLFLTFFPQEDDTELNRLRANLTPFLKAVPKALFVELKLGLDLNKEITKSIIDEIIRNIPAENSTQTTRFFSGQTFDTLHAELDGLMNLK